MAELSSLNEGWVFHDHAAAGLTQALAQGASVTLPHNAVDLPFNYFDEKAFQRAFTYQRILAWRPEFDKREVSLEFDGAMAASVVYLNGEIIARHRDGYTPFSARLTGKLKQGDNLVAVTIDGSENPEIPPFGGRIDYLTYAGLYRDVWLKIAAPIAITNVKIETRDVLQSAKALTLRCDIANPQGLAFIASVTAILRGPDGATIRSVEAQTSGESAHLEMLGLEDIALWDIDDPALYEMSVVVRSAHGEDSRVVPFGFRTAQFTPEGFRLNGRPLKILGLNRHQAFPYVGYAMGRRAQERDADMLKHELHCNLARTSHYPQSPYFLDRCDRIGLLVFEEIPGWQHIGGEAWKAESIANVRRMIERDWNHPSIIAWGVRINESQDSHDFYVETNRLAHELDSTRQTGGVRFITDSELLEDIYTMNDFILGAEELPGANRGRTALRNQREVTGLNRDVPYLITEFGGHMYPTKRWDQEQRQAEHVTRHLEVIDAAFGDPNISGCIGWCFFDYNTHKDFGSGDRICHHGVTDMFREPKFAAYAYRSQVDPEKEIVMQPVTWWARGERNIGGVLPLIVLTNCDEVEIRYGDLIVKRAGPDRETYRQLPHAPVVFDRRQFSKDELGLWGMKWDDLTMTGFVGGKAVKTLHMVADPVPTRLEVAIDDTKLSAQAKDSTRVIVRALDQAGNIMPFLDDPVEVRVEGPARLLGPSSLVLKGGTIGFWLETSGGAGPIALHVASPRFKPVEAALSAGP